MARPRHTNKAIEEAVQYAESHGWRFVRRGSHAWGILHCPHPGRDGHWFPVYSTPRHPEDHAKDLRRFVDRCQHIRRTDP